MTPRPAGAFWLAIVGAVGVALVVLYPDGYQQDAGHHFLFARWAWTHPELLVGVWSRPLFTFLYSVPAFFGYPVAKLFTVVICLATAHQTCRLAEQLRLDRAPLAVPLLFLQPSFLMLSSETMTEPLFALLFVVALRLHVAGRVAVGMMVASLMILARPEGFFLGALWGVWVLLDARDARPWWRRLPGTLRLAIGAGLWWLAALVVSGDPLFIPRNWPKNWDLTSAVYGVGPVWTFVARLPEIAGPVLAVVFLLGLWRLVARREHGVLTTAFLTLFVVHTILRTFGWLGSAGYARYFVCVSPAIALITLAGWNEVARRLARTGRAIRVTVASVVWGGSVIAALLYVDMAGFYDRDARAVSDMHAWFVANPRPVSRLLWSQAYMCIAFDRDPFENAVFSGLKDADLELLRQSPPGTLVFWDADTGPAWHGLKPVDFEAAGYARLHSRTYVLDGWLRESRWLPFAKPRLQEMTLLYKGQQP